MQPARAPSSLRSALDALFAELPARVRVAGGGGEACRAISEVYDAGIRERFDAAVAQAGAGVPLSLIATGGWARRELAPYSDIDFIILHDRAEPVAKKVSDLLLYPLWDDKLAIGHAVREPKAVIRLAKDDLATATALLDGRHIAGDRRLTAELMRGTLAALAPGGNPNDFITALATEQANRHKRFGASIYLLEPNLKQGIGALRDLATALWAAEVRWIFVAPGERAPRGAARMIEAADPPTADAVIGSLVAIGQLTNRQAQVLGNARDFLLRIRALVQLTTRRRLDQLTFELQEAIAPALYPDARAHDGETRAAVAPAVEALMSDFYVHARGVLQLTDRMLESARVPGRRRPKIENIDPSLLAIDGELAISNVRLFSEQPSEMVRLFRVSVDRQLPIQGHTRELVAETIAHDPEALARDPRAARLLLDALCDLRDAAQPSALEIMHQVGILAALMPGWGPCTARVQHDLYHVYTVDQHQLYAVAMLKQIARGELAAEHPTATALWREVADARQTAPLLLGTLLHDVGKPLGKGHAEKGAVIAHAVAERLGLSPADAELTAFLVRQHLTMSHLSQRRDLSDPEVIARFAEHVVGDEQHLVQLYLLTLCDTAMTAPDNLSAWKDNLLRELVVKTREYFLGRASGDLGKAASEEAVALRTRLAELAGADALPIIDAIDPRLFVQLTPRQTARHVALIRAATATPSRVGVEVHCWPLKGHSEVAIVAPDAPGVLAAIAGALTANRVDVLGAVLGHVDLPGADRLVVDVFYVRDLKGEAISEDDPRWGRLADDLRGLLPPDPDKVATLIARRRPKSNMPSRVTPGVPTKVELHDDSSAATIVEISTRDRVGVLYAITQTLADLGLDISLAKITTEGEKVADTFYVTRAGQRLTDEADRRRLVERLSQAVEAPGLTGS